MLGHLVRFGLLHGCSLHGHLLAAQIGHVDLVRIALLHGPCRSGIEMAYEINRFQTFFGHGERRNADIVLGTDRRNDRIEVRRLRHGLKTEHIGERLRDIDIETNRGLAVLRKEFGGSVRRVHTDGELAVLRHIVGQQFGNVIVFLHRRNVISRQLARFRTAIGRSRIVASITGTACRSSKQHRNAQRTCGSRLQTFLRFHILFSYVSLDLFDRI